MYWRSSWRRWGKTQKKCYFTLTEKYESKEIELCKQIWRHWRVQVTDEKKLRNRFKNNHFLTIIGEAAPVDWPLRKFSCLQSQNNALNRHLFHGRVTCWKSVIVSKTKNEDFYPLCNNMQSLHLILKRIQPCTCTSVQLTGESAKQSNKRVYWYERGKPE